MLTRLISRSEHKPQRLYHRSAEKFGPSVTLELIFSFLSPYEIAKNATVCRRFSLYTKNIQILDERAVAPFKSTPIERNYNLNNKLGSIKRINDYFFWYDVNGHVMHISHKKIDNFIDLIFSGKKLVTSLDKIQKVLIFSSNDTDSCGISFLACKNVPLLLR